MVRQHLKTCGTSTLEVPGKKPNECPYCGEQFKSKYSYAPHIKLHKTSNPGELKCLKRSCVNRRFPSTAELMLHINAYHRRFSCKHCGKFFTSYEAMFLHSQRHSQLRPFACDAPNCNYHSVSENELQRHKILQHSELAGTCFMCGKEFSDMRNFKNHVNSHETGMPGVIKCLYRNCRHTFSSTYDLKKHTDDDHQQHFSCDECGKRFAKLSLLNIHKKRHAQFKCDVPGCSFKVRIINDLQLHKRKKHAISDPNSSRLPTRQECNKQNSQENAAVQVKDILID